MLDVVLQMSLFNKKYREALWPFVQKVLMSVPHTLSCAHYMKFILAIKMARKVMGKEKTLLLRKVGCNFVFS